MSQTRALLTVSVSEAGIRSWKRMRNLKKKHMFYFIMEKIPWLDPKSPQKIVIGVLTITLWTIRMKNSIINILWWQPSENISRTLNIIPAQMTLFIVFILTQTSLQVHHLTASHSHIQLNRFQQMDTSPIACNEVPATIDMINHVGAPIASKYL